MHKSVSIFESERCSCLWMLYGVFPENSAHAGNTPCDLVWSEGRTSTFDALSVDSDKEGRQTLHTKPQMQMQGWRARSRTDTPRRFGLKTISASMIPNQNARNQEGPETASTQVASLRPPRRRATGEASTKQRAVKSGKKPHRPTQSVGFLN